MFYFKIVILLYSYRYSKKKYYFHYHAWNSSLLLIVINDTLGCTSDEWECPDGACIPLNYRCDGTPDDCDANADEQDCGSDPGKFYCY